MEYLTSATALISQYGALAILVALACLAWAISDYARHARMHKQIIAEIAREQGALLQALGVLEATLRMYADDDIYLVDANGQAVIFSDCGSRARATLETIEAMLGID